MGAIMVQLNDLEDNELAFKAARGDARAFEALINRHYTTIFKFAYKFCGHKTRAEDITQDVCIKLARSLGSFEGSASFTSWLYRVVVTTATDYMRKNARHGKMRIHIDPALKGSSSVGEDRLHARQILEEIRNLPEGEREAVMLVFVEDMTHAQAAEIMGCAEGTVSWKISEARKKLKYFENRNDGGQQ
tara:strand:- start:360 stop:926 length:567 start_codon:yes stop_codon:yes gene_type:complete